MHHDYIDWAGGEGGGANPEDENLDSVYMFAWALDGRRIGESGTGATGRAESPNSITAPIMASPLVINTRLPGIPLSCKGHLVKSYSV